MRFVKTAPKKEGYYWVTNEEFDVVFIAWFIPNGICHETDFITCEDDEIHDWEYFAKYEYRRSAAEVKPW